MEERRDTVQWRKSEVTASVEVKLGCCKGPFIYDIHIEGEGMCQAREVAWTLSMKYQSKVLAEVAKNLINLRMFLMNAASLIVIV